MVHVVQEKKCGTKCGTNCGTSKKILSQILILTNSRDLKEVWVLEVWVLVLDTRFQFLNFVRFVKGR